MVAYRKPYDDLQYHHSRIAIADIPTSTYTHTQKTGSHQVSGNLCYILENPMQRPTPSASKSMNEMTPNFGGQSSLLCVPTLPLRVHSAFSL